MNTLQIPQPSAIDGRQWSVEETDPMDRAAGTAGWTDVKKAVMHVPLSQDPYDRFVRIHELLHAKHTPKRDPNKEAEKAGCLHRDIQILEDARIHLKGARALPNVPTFAEDTPARISKNLEKMEKGDACEALAMMLVQSGRCEDECALRGITRAADDQLIALRTAAPTDVQAEAESIALEVLRTLYRSRATFKDGTRCAKLMRDLINQAKARLAPKNPKADEGKAGADELEAKAKHQSTTKCGWGTLGAILRPALKDHYTTPDQEKPRKIAQVVGPRVGHIRRIMTDGKSFARRLRREFEGGTVLIDASGSMHIDHDAIGKFIKECPAATVAIYSAQTWKRTPMHPLTKERVTMKSDTGHISIIAEKGRVASPALISRIIEFSGVCNIIDGPALQWLSKQDGPRIWICDGLVTGTGDLPNAALTREAARLLRLGRIQMHHSFGAFIDSRTTAKKEAVS